MPMCESCFLAGNNCTPETDTATALATARTIGGVSFNGSGNIVPQTVQVVDTTDSTCFPALFESATGSIQPKTDAGLTYNASTAVLYATDVVASSDMALKENINPITDALEKVLQLGGYSFDWKDKKRGSSTRRSKRMPKGMHSRSRTLSTKKVIKQKSSLKLGQLYKKEIVTMTSSSRSSTMTKKRTESRSWMT